MQAFHANNAIFTTQRNKGHMQRRFVLVLDDSSICTSARQRIGTALEHYLEFARPSAAYPTAGLVDRATNTYTNPQFLPNVLADVTALIGQEAGEEAMTMATLGGQTSVKRGSRLAGLPGSHSNVRMLDEVSAGATDTASKITPSELESMERARKESMEAALRKMAEEAGQPMPPL